MKNYKLQPSCMDCKHVFIYSDYDEGETYYCTEDGEPRPLCGSVAMNEYDRVYNPYRLEEKGQDEKEYDFKKWMRWTETRLVSPRGICDCFKVEREDCRVCGMLGYSGGRRCCGYLLIGGDAAFIQEDGRIVGDCPKGYWKRGVVK